MTVMTLTRGWSGLPLAEIPLHRFPPGLSVYSSCTATPLSPSRRRSLPFGLHSEEIQLNAAYGSHFHDTRTTSAARCCDLGRRPPLKYTLLGPEIDACR